MKKIILILFTYVSLIGYVYAEDKFTNEDIVGDWVCLGSVSNDDWSKRENKFIETLSQPSLLRLNVENENNTLIFLIDNPSKFKLEMGRVVNNSSETIKEEKTEGVTFLTQKNTLSIKNKNDFSFSHKIIMDNDEIEKYGYRKNRITLKYSCVRII